MTSVYPFQSHELEQWRLGVQSAAIEPLSVTMLEGAGIVAGSRVLDIGCGPGDLSFLAAKMAGPAGSVTGIDRDPSQILAAQKRAGDLGLTNVSFIQADVETYAPDTRFDAIIGRYILIYVKSPEEVVSTATRWLRPNGSIGFIEMDIFPGVRSHIWPPVSDQTGRAIQYIADILIASGVHTYMGARLPSILAAVGDVGIETSAPSQWGPQSLALPLAALRSILPMARQLNDPRADTFDPDLLYEKEIIGRDNTTVTTPPLSIAAWASVSAGNETHGRSVTTEGF